MKPEPRTFDAGLERDIPRPLVDRVGVEKTVGGCCSCVDQSEIAARPQSRLLLRSIRTALS